MAAASRFAGLIGALSGKKAGTDDKDDKNAKGEKPTQNDGESDEDFQKRLKKWEEDQDDDESAENPKDTTKDDEDGKAKKAAKEAEDKIRAEGHAAGVAAERARWGDTLASTAAAGKVIAACSLLADTDMNAASVQRTLAALPAETPRSTLAARHPEPTPAPAPAGGEDPTKAEGPKGFAARVAAAVATVRPEKAK